MFSFTKKYSRLDNTAITDSAGGTFWVGSAASSSCTLPIRGKHSAYFKSAVKAQCEAAKLVLEARKAKTPKLLRLVCAAALQREVPAWVLARLSDIDPTFLSTLSRGDRPVCSISDEFARQLGHLLELPFLVVLHLAGRIDKEFFAGLGQSAENTARRVEEDAAAAMEQAQRVLDDAYARVIAEERKVRAQRQLTPENAQALLTPGFKRLVSQFKERSGDSRATWFKSLRKELQQLAATAATASEMASR